MESVANLERAKRLFGANFLGPDEVRCLIEKFEPDYSFNEIPQINYSWDVLEKYAKEGYILVMGVPEIYPQNKKLTIRMLRDKFGFDPNVAEPCFYNQDWYLSESFIDEPLSLGWYLIKKEVFEDTRAEQPVDIMAKGINFPTAILCTYTFFTYYFARNQYLWWHDFVWCCDTDHNGDRIYVGKYHDVDGVNKNGFSIHRHLALRPCYGSVNYIG